MKCAVNKFYVHSLCPDTVGIQPNFFDKRITVKNTKGNSLRDLLFSRSGFGMFWS
jgi:hypothetical protein